MTTENKEWARNLTKTEDGIFRTINGNADELIGIGRTIKAGFACSRVDITNGKYDAIVDVGSGTLLRIQIKGVGKQGSVSFMGGGRSGQQINRAVKSRAYKYTTKDIDILMAVDSTNGDCYIIPVKDLRKWGTTKSLSTLEEYRENWNILIKIANEKHKNIKTIDLFAGIGGVRLAFEKAGFHTVFANDFEPKCANTYDLNFSIPKLTIEDIKKINPKDLPNFDLLLGGFPCQPFSVAGKRKGMEDERGTLFFEIANILKERRPVGFFLENVKNLTGHNFGRTFKIILNRLDVLGYEIKYAVLNSMEYGDIPQNRERVYIVGFLKETKLIKKFEFPKQLQLKKNIKDILENEIPDIYYYNNKPLFEKLKDFNFKTNTIYQWRRKYVRENKSGVCPTLTANMGTGGHNVPLVMDKKGVRKLTPRECARIQGFPDTYKLPKIADSYLYKQIGNSVSVPVVYRIAKNMMLAISGM